jgi:hypothetical protein
MKTGTESTWETGDSLQNDEDLDDKLAADKKLPKEF